MSDISNIAGPAIGGILGLAGGLFSGGAQAQHNNEMRKLIRGTRDANFEFQREAWERDDYSVRRRVRDLKAAGLSPTLAVKGGMGPMASNAAKGSVQGLPTEAPGRVGVESALGIAQGIADISRTMSEKKLMENNAKNVGLKNALDEGLLDTRINKEKMEYLVQRASYLFDIDKRQAEAMIAKNREAISRLDRKERNLMFDAKTMLMSTGAFKGKPYYMLDLFAQEFILEREMWNFKYYQDKGWPTTIGHGQWDRVIEKFLNFIGQYLPKGKSPEQRAKEADKKKLDRMDPAERELELYRRKQG